MTYEEMLEKLYNLKGTGLELTKILAQLGRPEKKVKCIRVGGTNGKGSTCAFLSHILIEAGYSVGLFTSPHLTEPEERIQINGQCISRQEFQIYFERVWDTIWALHGSDAESIARFFEVLVAIALLYFYEQKVDIALIEAGVGGRRDDTNVVHPLFGILTSVDLDHQEVLGNTLEAIAVEKIGIVPPGVTLLCAETKPSVLALIQRECEKQNSKLILVEFPQETKKIVSWENQRFNWNDFKKLELQMLGAYQIKNAATALSALALLEQHDFKITDSAVRQGLKQTQWPGRMELLQKNPYILLDGAKNPAGLRALKESLSQLDYANLILILGISTRKEIAEMIAEIVPIAHRVILTQAPFRGSEPSQMEAEVQKHTLRYEMVSAPEAALERALKQAQLNDLICVTGSLFLVGETRKIWQDRRFAKAGEIG